MIDGVGDRGEHQSGDPIPGECSVIEVRVGELRQLFNAIDPSPFHKRDLDPAAADFIVGWSKDLPSGTTLALLVHLDRGAGPAGEATALRDAVHEFFGQRAAGARRQLRQLFRRGRTSLAIGLTFLTLSIVIGDAIAGYFEGRRLAEVLRESLIIGGWVAMWGPLEIFLYAWWPIRSDIRLFERLSSMPVRIAYESNGSSDAWRSDWPAVQMGPREESREQRSAD